MKTYTGLHADLTNRIVGCAIEVHRHLGPGMLESAYESGLAYELSARTLTFKRQIGVPLLYKGALLGEFRPDLVIEDAVIVEVKSITRFEAIHTSQMLTYLRIAELRVGLLLNFNVAVMKEGIRRVIR